MSGEVPRGDTKHGRLRIIVRGVVQGVGFRPFVYNAARDESLVGWVTNDTDAVRIEVQGERASLQRFLEAIRTRSPSQAHIDSVQVSEISVADREASECDFAILSSRIGAAPRPTIPADLATCTECQREILDAGGRRHRYPFTNCTNCGPRWSIIQQLPYDRPRTSMSSFPLCEACRAEYEDPGDRRFHAQPIACPQCGPSLQLLTTDGRTRSRSDNALGDATRAVLSGQIVAVKGLGGFQLIVDATDQTAVRRLRRRKNRPHKPLAVMLGTIQQIQQLCLVSEDERKALQSHAAPIMLLRRRPDVEPGDIAPSVAPGNPYLGAMLPYTPLHHLLLRSVSRPVVCTSGNLSEEPMAISTEDALSRLKNIADLILTHDRPIVRPVDDSVARFNGSRFQIARRARGYAPLPIQLKSALPTILAVGGHLKNTIALSLGSSVILSPHVGDLDNALSVDVHRRVIEDLLGFFDVQPAAVACDMHPDYASTRHAQQLASTWGVPLLPVQHHHAHVAACMAENEIEGPVLGLSWDGTGYGADGTVWGGEFLRCSGSQSHRLAHLRTFPLPGGDRAAREPRRAALGVLFEIMGEDAAEFARQWFEPAELKTLLAALHRPKLFPRTSSMGRLFDAIAAMCGLFDRCTFEGQAAMSLEFTADPNVKQAYPLPLSAGEPAAADWEPLVRAVLADRAGGVPPEVVAAKFHNALAELAVDVAGQAECHNVVLAGGCFQNALLAERVCARLLESEFDVYTHRDVPPGDGGIALGQVLVAVQKIKESSNVSGNPR